MIKLGTTEITSLPGIDKVYMGQDTVFGPIIPAEYQRLKYITNAGGSALNTGVVLSDTDVIYVNFEFDANNLNQTGDKFLFSCLQGYTGGGLWLETFKSASTDNKWYVRFGSAASANKVSTSAQKTGKHLLSLKKSNFSIDGTLIASPVYSSMPDTPLGIGARIAADGTSINYGCYGNFYDESGIVDSTGYKRWWGYAVKEISTGYVGMYDIVSRQFHKSVTATPFVAGPSV